MNLKTLSLQQTVFNILAWWIALYFYITITIIGNYDFFEESPMMDYLQSSYIHLEIFLQGVLFGFIFSVINHLAENSAIRKKSFLSVILIKSLLYFFSLMIIALLVNLLFITMNFVNQEQIEYMLESVSYRFTLSVVLFYSSFIVILNGINEISRKLGPHEWLNLLVGKYREPKTEELIFCFIDLKNSTRIAESLGHKKYSSFLRDCFHLLSNSLKSSNARVYQYVGDEVVLYWPKKDGMKNNNCINAYFRFQESIDKRASFFEKKYGFIPYFKAGMDTGEVTITEVGDIKRELAFHGDVLNSAARLEKKCNELNETFLATKSLVTQLKQNGTYNFIEKGSPELKGKQEIVDVFAIRSNK
ncbi:MAG: adenylate/guanylate cyclase domain-containing protein [bacterium]|nr:adenylate/guanylate cyclase domain-containing protein [bacterium]